MRKIEENGIYKEFYNNGKLRCYHNKNIGFKMKFKYDEEGNVIYRKTNKGLLWKKDIKKEEIKECPKDTIRFSAMDVGISYLNRVESGKIIVQTTEGTRFFVKSKDGIIKELKYNIMDGPSLEPIDLVVENIRSGAEFNTLEKATEYVKRVTNPYKRHAGIYVNPETFDYTVYGTYNDMEYVIGFFGNGDFKSLEVDMSLGRLIHTSKFRKVIVFYFEKETLYFDRKYDRFFEPNKFTKIKYKLKEIFNME